ncbi:MAG: hypothetical protein MJZ29_02435 [Bacteroidaceae bacterium]|nr:hypothetical protein [Bacteroidaceae bacterium]
MKLKALSLSMLAALLAGCSSDVADEQAAVNNQESPEVINATIEQAQIDAASRATFAADASFIWMADDRIGVSQTNGSTTKFSTFKLSKGAGTAKGTFIGSISSGYTIGNKLVYPKSLVSSLSGSTLTLNLPAEYDYAYGTESFGTITGNVNSANMPMLANYTGGGVEFKHLGGYFVFEISKIPAGCNKFEFEAVNKKISGTFTVNTSASEPSYSTSTSESENKITIKFPETTSECKRLFIVPVPVGSYEYEWNIYDTSGDIRGFGASDDAISVSRGQIKAKRLDCASISTGDDPGSSTANMVNGHEFVDLGLPSGLKWATMNVGASTPEGYGDYFAWGETEPYYTEGHSQDSPCTNWKTGKSGYNWESYKWCNGSSTSMTKYCTSSNYGTVDDKTTLELADDAAVANWGGSWRMPTKAEQDELRTNCTWTWTTQSGVNGYKVTSKTNGNSIFLPAAGYRYDISLDYVGSRGYYWSSSLSTSSSSDACYLRFDSDYVDRYGSRGDGQSVRAVCP